jgi:hypothetical protein
MTYLRIIGFCLLGLLASQNVLAAKVYTWTDNKGVVHFGERPPKDVKATLVKARTGHSDPTPAPAAPAPTTGTITQAEAANNVRASLKDPTRCAQARENLSILNSVARIKTQDASGNSVYMTEDDKAKQREAMQAVANQACE